MFVYNVYKEGSLLAEELERYELINFLDMHKNTLDYHQNNLLDGEVMEIKGYQVKRSVVDRKPRAEEGKATMPQDWIDDWHNMTIAADMVRTGQGKIVTMLVDGEPRKVTVPR